MRGNWARLGAWPSRRGRAGPATAHGPAPRPAAQRDASGRSAPARPAAQRLDERGHVAPFLRGQLVDAGDQEFALRVAWLRRAGRDVVVVVQSGGLGGGGADRGDGQVEAAGQPIQRGWAGWPGQIPGHRQGVDGGPGQTAAPGHVAVRQAPFAQPVQDQALQRVGTRLHRCGGHARAALSGTVLVPCRIRHHDQPSRLCASGSGRDPQFLPYSPVKITVRSWPNNMYGRERTSGSRSSPQGCRAVPATRAPQPRAP